MISNDILIKGADKGSVVLVGDRTDYIKDVEKQLGDEQIYEVTYDPAPLLKTINSVTAKIRKGGDLK